MFAEIYFDIPKLISVVLFGTIGLKKKNTSCTDFGDVTGRLWKMVMMGVMETRNEENCL